jgi:hypothetical protein
MTIAISLKVDDGIVLASDSATTLCRTSPGGGEEVSQIWNNAKKIFRLHTELPLGAVTWGLASVGRSSLKILAKDFRNELMGGQLAFDPNAYTVQQVAILFKEFMFDRHYQQAFDQIPADQRPELGFMVAGYSSGQPRGEVWLLYTGQGIHHGPDLAIGQDESAITWQGQPLSLRRLLLGFDAGGLRMVLHNAGLQQPEIEAIIQSCSQEFGVGMVKDGMPIQDAIDLAIYLEETSAGFSRFCDGPAFVGGPVEVAVLTRYEGFKWIKRKHFYDKALNP